MTELLRLRLRRKSMRIRKTREYQHKRLRKIVLLSTCLKSFIFSTLSDLTLMIFTLLWRSRFDKFIAKSTNLKKIWFLIERSKSYRAIDTIISLIHLFCDDSSHYLLSFDRKIDTSELSIEWISSSFLRVNRLNNLEVYTNHESTNYRVI